MLDAQRRMVTRVGRCCTPATWHPDVPSWRAQWSFGAAGGASTGSRARNTAAREFLPGWGDVAMAAKLVLHYAELAALHGQAVRAASGDGEWLTDLVSSRTVPFDGCHAGDAAYGAA